MRSNYSTPLGNVEQHTCMEMATSGAREMHGLFKWLKTTPQPSTGTYCINLVVVIHPQDQSPVPLMPTTSTEMSRGVGYLVAVRVWKNLYLF